MKKFSRQERQKRKRDNASVSKGQSILTTFYLVIPRMNEFMEELPDEVNKDFSNNIGNYCTTNSKALELLLKAAEKNAQKKTGKRFDAEIKLFSTYLYLTGGCLLYETLYNNFKASLPSLSTIRQNLQNDYNLCEGKLRFIELKEYLLKHNYPLDVWISEDATAITAQEKNLSHNLNETPGRKNNLGNDTMMDDMEDDQNILNDMEDDQNMLNMDSDTNRETNTFSEITVKKGTLCWLLDNKNPRLSTDRLERVRGPKCASEVLSRVLPKKAPATKERKRRSSGTSTGSVSLSSPSYADSDESETFSDLENDKSAGPEETGDVFFFPEKYYSVAYKENWYIGRILEITNNGLVIKFLKYDLDKYIWPQSEDIQTVEERKDQCPTCTAYQSANPETKVTLEEKYNLHIDLKNRARKEKNSDKTAARSDNERVHSCNFDLQQVLYVPTDATNPTLFYKTKLAMYNFTIFNCGDNTGKCYMWTEVEGARGPCEIASCLFHHLKSLSATTKDVRLFSDTCGGQNKNQYVAAMFIYAVQVLSIEVIDQKFLISGHSQMECDSMHARIEIASKNRPVYLPHEWMTIAKNAKQNEPKYQVFDKNQIGFLDWKALAKMIMVNRNKDENGDTLNWHHIKWIRYEKQSPLVMKVKTVFHEDFRSISVVPRRGRRVTINAMEKCLKPLQEQKRKISAMKLKHLEEICKSGGVPDDCKQFFSSLIADEDVQDQTLIPDVNDDEDHEFFSQ
ncbi:unnamed protein product [Phaedon cochleariae]|uniref:DUF7869 domain-containing protein n=1 Tax=Phaedon cochleariae TaxID=80249 RepID=A0A9P0DXQ9_PHACE|nr:unnamed protein product [Phaedon cochleariae]